MNGLLHLLMPLCHIGTKVSEQLKASFHEQFSLKPMKFMNDG